MQSHSLHRTHFCLISIPPLPPKPHPHKMYVTPSPLPTLSYLFFPPLLHMCSPLPSPLQCSPPTFTQLLRWRLMKAVIRCQAHHRFGGLHHLKCVYKPFGRDVQRIGFLQRYYNQGGVFLRPSSLSLQGCFWWRESGEGWGEGGAC